MSHRALDERVQHEYAHLAPLYDRRWRVYLDRSLEATLARLPADGGESILDVGCGSGELLRRLHARYPDARLTGIDASAAMLATARAKLGTEAQLACAHAAMQPFPGATFDLVVSTSVLHHLPKPEAALAEIRRVLKPGGWLVLTDWCGDFLSCRLMKLWLSMRRRPIVRVYRGAECQRMLERAGFRTQRLDRYRINWPWGLMTLTAAR
ncbi:MAG TPA: class I SAM-dependent methyltransferase [Gammaproteobacteria bacterium]|nr:class I SAM-dependent methyltransferase [Gammaproteobacteria bacterium]